MPSTKLAGALVALAFGLLAVTAQEAAAVVYTVDNANSSGAGSLRNRIIAANNNVGVVDTIEFDLPGASPLTITPVNPLPAITDPVIIDGYSEPDSTPPADGVNPVIQVAIDASNTNRGLEVATGGDGSTIRGLSVHSGAADGIRLNANGNRVEGSYLGLEETGAAAGNASDGVQIDGDDNVVGGTAPEDRNVISANGFGGVSATGTNNRVKHNTIGTDPDVSTDLGNVAGVWLSGDDNTVGSTPTGGDAGNVISGNDVAVQVELGADNKVVGNLIGTNATGDADLDDNFFTGDIGVLVETGASSTLVGTAEAGNVIGGVATAGVLLAGNENVVQGNKVGTNADGDAALVSMRGMRVTGNDNTIGGPEGGDGNVVSGSSIQGIEIRADDVTDVPSERNTVEGNLIGTNADGDEALPNGHEGIEVIDANDNEIVANVISGNGTDGIRIRFDDTTTADDNQIVGNAIGTDATTGTLALGNGGAGVRVDDGAGNEVGTVSYAVPNTIAFNDDDGVTIDGGARATTMVRNAVFDNGGLGIDLDDDDVTLNDAGDGDAGANGLLNFPEITGATPTAVDWQLVDSLPGTTFLLEFYANAACDPDFGHGEGQSFLGTTVATTDASGNAAGSTPITAVAGQSVSATATTMRFVPVGGFPPLFVTEYGATSELSACVTVQ